VHDHQLFNYCSLWMEAKTNAYILRFSEDIKQYVKNNKNPVFSY